MLVEAPSYYLEATLVASGMSPLQYGDDETDAVLVVANGVGTLNLRVRARFCQVKQSTGKRGLISLRCRKQHPHHPTLEFARKSSAARCLPAVVLTQAS